MKYSLSNASIRYRINHYAQLQNALDKITREEAFRDIEDPVQWQKEQRHA